MTKLDALHAFGRAFNYLEVEHLDGVLAPEMKFTSQEVFAEMESREEYLDYLAAKFLAIRRSSAVVTAEIARVQAFGAGVGLLLTQFGKRIGVLLIKMEGDLVSRADLCTVAPHPSSVDPTGDVPM
jgi:hypothetical protein